jgi:hypothetical protein
MKHTRRLAVLAVALAVAPAALSAQTVMVRVLASEASTPVFGALTYLVDPSGETVRNGLSDERGRALFVGVAAGAYRVRAEMIGMATAETDLFDVGEGMSVSQELRLSSSAIQLEGLSVEADGGRCRVRPGGEGLAVASVWDEARKALSAAAFTDQQGSYRYETMIYTRDLDRSFTILSEEEKRREGYMLTPFESLPADSLVAYGFVQRAGMDYLYFAPDAAVLLSDPFLDTHCFRLERGADGLLGLSFEPTGEKKSVVDIAGTMWIDAESAELQWLEFRYQYLDDEIASNDIGGRVDFRRMPAGTWIVPEWWIRMPAVAERVDDSGRRSRFINGYRQVGGVVLEAREAGGRRLGQRVATGGFEGVVMDSVGVPIASARVGVVGSNQEVYTDAAGRYGIVGLNPGRYQVRFVDPALESIGFVPEPVARDVIRGESTTLDFHMPSVGDVLFEACRGVERRTEFAILAGMVRDERRRPVEGAQVLVEWSTFRIRSPGGDVTVDGETIDGFQTTTDASGSYRFCGVPTDMLLRVRALEGESQSDVYELRVGVDVVAGLQTIVLARD